MTLPTDERERRIAALEANNWNFAAAGRELGISRETIRDWARENDISSRSVPDGFKVIGESTLYDADGIEKLKWVKTAADRERQAEMAREMIAALVKDVPAAKPVKSPQASVDDQLACYLIGDAHLGCYSWADQTGDDFDTDIAMRDLMGAASTLVRAAPASKKALFINLGDYFHANSQKGVTPKSGNILDTDTRWARVVQVGVKVQTSMIDLALRKHEEVIYRPTAGNHDPDAAIMLGEIMRAYYRNEPRVVVDNSPRPFWTYRFGSNLIGVCHGDGGKFEDHAGRLAVEARGDWGECEFRYVWSGHVHHKKQFEKLGVLVESFRTLAARDGWHAHAGYLAGREMQQITLHKDFGEIARAVASLRRIREAA